MWKFIILIVVLIICFFFIAETEISFKPFKISCNRLLFALGILFLLLGGCLIYFQGKKDTYKVIRNEISQKDEK